MYHNSVPELAHNFVNRSYRELCLFFVLPTAQKQHRSNSSRSLQVLNIARITEAGKKHTTLLHFSARMEATGSIRKLRREAHVSKVTDSPVNSGVGFWHPGLINRGGAETSVQRKQNGHLDASLVAVKAGGRF